MMIKIWMDWMSEKIGFDVTWIRNDFYCWSSNSEFWMNRALSTPIGIVFHTTTTLDSRKANFEWYACERLLNWPTSKNKEAMLNSYKNSNCHSNRHLNTQKTIRNQWTVFESDELSIPHPYNPIQLASKQ